MINSYISTKSPYMLFTEDTSFKYGVFEIFIYSGDQHTSRPIDPTYSLVSSTFSNKGNVEISPFIDSITEQQFDGTYSTKGRWVDSRYYLTDDIGNITGSSSTMVSQYALPGYTYFEDGLNFEHGTNGLMMDNVEIQIAAGEGINVPIFTDVANTITLKNHLGLILDTVDVTLLRGNNVDEKVFYYQYPSGVNQLGTLEVTSNSGTRKLRIVEVDECKYDPMKITFLNRYGVLQDLWFFKRKNVTIKVSQDDFKRSLINVQAENYNKYDHQIQVYNKTANEEVTLNSGFVPESFNDVFKQLIISDRVWLTGDINGRNTIRPVNVTSSNFNYKYKIDEKLINHELKLDFAFDSINNIA